jgi:hypothetical protein
VPGHAPIHLAQPFVAPAGSNSNLRSVRFEEPQRPSCGVLRKSWWDGKSPAKAELAAAPLPPAGGQGKCFLLPFDVSLCDGKAAVLWAQAGTCSSA